MTDVELPIRVCTPEDWKTLANLIYAAFHSPVDEQAQELDRKVWEPDRSLVTTDAGAIAGHTTAFTRDLTVPGNVIPAAHVTMVFVAPTHRRRGVLTRMMHRQLREVPEPVAVLWASEGRIYPRFGYGLAAYQLELAIEARELRLPDVPAAGRLRAGEPAALQPEITKVYDELRADRPGWSSRHEAGWANVLADTAYHRSGATELRAVVHEGPAGVDGYALWRTRSGWASGGPDGQVHVNEVAAAGPGAYAALWRFLLGIDLVRTVTYGHAAVDEPLLHLANEPRRLNARQTDSLYVRVVQVGAALAARRYATPIDVVIDVTDPLLTENAGRWRLVGDLGGASCVRTDAPADLACDVRDLGAVYLGGTSLSALAAAGRVRELRPGSLWTASTAFGWHRPPVAPEVF